MLVSEMNNPSLSRRGFLQAGLLSAGGLAAGSAFAKFDHRQFMNSLGVQLYTVRSILPERPAEVLHEIEAMGYREAEVVRGGMEKIWPAFQATKLKPVSLHVDAAFFLSDDTAGLKKEIENAKEHGFQYVVMPYVGDKDRGGLDVYRRLAFKLNNAGQMAQSAGVQLAYHNHAFEFEPMGGTTPMDVLMKETDPKLVGLELDIFWVSVTGNDPVEVLRRYPGRVWLAHLKDKAEGTPRQYNERVPPSAFKEVGAGVMNIPAFLKAAADTNVRHYFVEQDQTPGDPLASLRQSYEYLESVEA
jgi:sugar phosphate isomerase/epimerase